MLGKVQKVQIKCENSRYLSQKKPSPKTKKIIFQSIRRTIQPVFTGLNLEIDQKPKKLVKWHGPYIFENKFL